MNCRLRITDGAIIDDSADYEFVVYDSASGFLSARRSFAHEKSALFEMGRRHNVLVEATILDDDGSPLLQITGALKYGMGFLANGHGILEAVEIKGELRRAQR